MSDALILYGSRARGEAVLDSDVDLILAGEGGDITPAVIVRGVSVHRYSQRWLLKQAGEGSLFAYHIAFEGVSLCSGDGFLAELRRGFKKKISYSEERVEALYILRMILESDRGLNQEIQRRYFWAIRTALICFSADGDRPLFASLSLEKLSGIIGLADHIRKRASETYFNCQAMGRRIEDLLGADLDSSLSGASLRNYLASRGGIARDSVHLVEGRDLGELPSNVTYM